MKKIKLICLVFLAAFTLQAQNPLSLNEAITRALKNNYSIEMVQNEERIAEIRNNWGTAGRYPYINLSLNDDNSYNINENENMVTNRFSAGANVNWTLFDGFIVKITKQRYEELEELSEKNTAIVVESTIQAVILAYYSVLLEKEKLQVFEDVMNLSEDRFQRAEERKELGDFVTYDVLQAQNAYLSDRSGYLTHEVAWKNAMRDLNYLMAEEASFSYTLVDSFQAVPVDYSLENLRAQLFENNKVLQNQYINQRLLENSYAAAKSDFYPTLDFRGGVTGTSLRNNYAERGESWMNSANIYGNFTLSFNLFSGGNRKRALEIAKIDEQTGLVEIDEMEHDLTNSLANIYEFYLVRMELLDVARENLEAARLNLQISREKFEAGAINSFNYRDVQNIYLNAALRELEAIYNFIDTHTALLRMTGVIIQEYE
ncbi:MAG: TolC family protein [Prolixibacteraceae bacterium]